MPFNVASSDLQVRFPDPRKNELVLDEVLTFEDNTGRVWTAQPGQCSDGASIPRLFWSLLGHPLHGPFRRGAILHDAYYRNQPYGRTRAEIDRLLYDCLIADGAGQVRARLVYTAVYTCGWWAWRRNRKQLTH